MPKLEDPGLKKGLHTYILDKEGMKVYPSLNPDFSPSAREKTDNAPISSGVPEIDKMLHGGIEKNTSTIITGPTGSGKTSLGLTFMKEAAGRGERSVVYLLEESPEVLKRRSKTINIPVEEMIENKNLQLITVNRGELTPEIFVHRVKKEVEENDTKLVMIDSVTAFNSLFLDENWNKLDLRKVLDSLRKLLINNNATLLMINEIPNITGDFRVTDDQISYLADNIIILRYIELSGGMQKAIGVLKKRLSSFETKLREFEISKYGLEVGEPMEDLSGILSGNPELTSEGRSNSNKKEG